ncbi:MATE family efflux transporter [Anaerosolibacter carboniphilus]|nr:MATE family efflux transporter [Anaerosolibacter carboniphilus]
MKLSKELKSIWNLSWPVIIGMILQSLLGTVDMKFISMIGTAESAGASISNSASGVVFVMSALVASGTVAIVARAFGEDNQDEVKRIGSQSIILAGIVGSGIGWVCSWNTYGILQGMFNPETSVLQSAAAYLNIIFLGTVFVFVNYTIRSILQALGDTKTPLYIFGAANVLNAILDPIFIFSLDYGVKGAAIATVLSNIFAFFMISYIYLKKVHEGRLMEYFNYGRLRLRDTLRILRIGLWSCLQQVSRPITGMMMFRIVSEVGKKEGIAAFGIGGQLFNYTFILLTGLTVAVSVMVGQNLGRKDLEKTDEIIREGLKVAMINMAIFAIPYMIFPRYIIQFFLNDEKVIQLGIEYLRIVYIGVIFVIFPTVYGGAFQGAGDTFPPMVSSIFANVLVKLPLAYFLAKNLEMGTDGVWWAIAISVMIEAGMIWFYFHRGTWKTKKV